MHPCALSPCQSWFRSWCPERRRNVNLTEEMGRRLVCGGASHATFDAHSLHTGQARAWWFCAPQSRLVHVRGMLGASFPILS